MLRLQSQTRVRARRRLFLGILCAALMAFSTTVQIVHNHGRAGTAQPGCSLCVVAHAGVSPSAPPAFSAIVWRAIDAAAPFVERPCKSFVFSFYSRPPPAESVPA